jgi:hypothetical protein
MARTKRRAKPKVTRKPKVAKIPKQQVLIAVKVPASKTSDTPQAKKLLDAVGRRPGPKHKRRR